MAADPAAGLDTPTGVHHFTAGRRAERSIGPRRRGSRTVARRAGLAAGRRANGGSALVPRPRRTMARIFRLLFISIIYIYIDRTATVRL